MDAWWTWDLVLMAAVGYLAIRCLVSLMRTRHKALAAQVQEQLQQEQKRRAKARRKKKAAEESASRAA